MITGLCFTAALFCQYRFAVHCGSIVLMRSQSKRFKEQFIHTTTGFAILYGLATIITAAIGGYVL